ncbi:hypothetical protein [Blastococcus aurantiacus]|nr:hypothetical protein [Blastococcus aurantiacus]
MSGTVAGVHDRPHQVALPACLRRGSGGRRELALDVRQQIAAIGGRR